MKTVLKAIASFFVMVFKGQLIMNLHLEKKFPQIVFTISLLIVIVLSGLFVDRALVKVETNKKIIDNLEIVHAQKSYEYQRMFRQSTVSRMLEEMGSKVKSPVKPAKDMTR